MDISQLKSDVDSLKTSVASADDALVRLEAQIAGLHPENFTQDDIDALDQSVKEARAALDNAVAGSNPPVEPQP